MQLGHLEIFVSDPERARHFYQEVLGFELETIQRERFVWMRAGSLSVLLRPDRCAEAAPTYQHAGSAVVLYTNDLDETAGRLRTHGVEFHDPDGSDGCLTFTDPDGNWMQLVDPGSH